MRRGGEGREGEKRVRAMTVEIRLRVARCVTSQFSLGSESGGEKIKERKKRREKTN